ncbi:MULTISPECIES: anaerobic ribonucleoside-triphosphate reductase [Pelosinus]|uniref:Anaerobic ribonucleoside-triphosphate reductase n=1 Tax=Pelosinus fermentans B4 TaxID=1149862 RepID=I8RJ19_9FIRM|nr:MULTISPECIES: anaerobic ribonucleoside-triphosphate reductase [Pelosinus]EIW18130.1 anaerobic ribonucleoside-triphosphate reductase [Pelosinus fermentans B4]EIW24167.1 anaerobic ribonucleoside-triphosphate reductase [Pelosinus fermentans A11]OAM94138.1 anaerobic ribonucleoside-triphosphate reductase [Pelosinus fermentans DSM 17108]SDR01084.1 ribonucleoside-triphosphate reductase class III catalytic subunit [Pelosinus fermentans]
MKIKKRDGREVSFDENKITEAIFKAAKAVGGADKQLAMELTLDVLRFLKQEYNGGTFGVEEVQDAVEKILIEKGHAKTAKAYILYRDKRTRMRDGQSYLMDAVAEILVETNRENANISNSPSAKMLQIASAASKSYYLNRLLPEHMANAHIKGDIHIHDLDFYGTTLTCVQIPLGKLLKDGFNNGHGYIRPPKRPASAAALAAIILQSSQNDMHGGQSFAFFDSDMAPFMEGIKEEEVYQAMEAFIYNLNSMHSRAGAQVPFSSLNIGTDTTPAGRRVTKNLLLAYEKGLGHGENPIFPNIIFRVKEGINFNKKDPNYDLFKLAIRVASQRLNPTFSFMDASFNKPYGDQIGYMGCRTRVMSNKCGPEVTNGRGNLSFTTVNLPRLAIQAERNLMKFYQSLSDLIDLTCEQLFHRYQVQGKLRVKDMPFLMGQGLYLDSDKLAANDMIADVIKHGTLSVGFIGLAEALIALTGYHHGEGEESQILGEEIVAFMRNKVDKATDKYMLNYTLLATPAEGLAGRFVKMDCREYGLIPGVTDKDYYTNSFHIPVNYSISVYDKIKIEAIYHKYTNAGHISYVEFTAPPVNNLKAVEDVIRYMQQCDIGYAGINFPVDFCEGCGYLGVIGGDTCPVCSMSDIKRVRRITGYLSTIDRFNDAKHEELEQRVAHL